MPLEPRRRLLTTLAGLALALSLLAAAPLLGPTVGAGALAALLLLLAWSYLRLWREVTLRRHMMDASPYRKSLYDREGRLIWHNGRAGEAWAEALASLPPRPHIEQVLQAALRHLPPPEREVEVARQLADFNRADGEATDVRDARGGWERLRHKRLAGGEVAVYAVDITRAKHSEMALADSEARLQSLLDRAPVGIWQLNDAGRTVFVNRQMLRIFQGEAPRGMAEAQLTLARPADAEGPFGFTPETENEAVLELPGQPPLRLLIAASAWIDAPDGTRCCVLSVLDVTPLKTAQARVEHMAEHDPLTGLCNRGTFQSGLQAMAADPKGGVLLLIDLDGFKSANERYGHAIGDALLVEAARRLREAVRPSDLVSRLGGDEFAILAFGAVATSATAIANRLRAGLRGPVTIEGADLSLSGCIGVACAPLHGEDGEAILRAAELSLYEAKAEGRDHVALFQPALREKSERRSELREAFAEALENGELELHVQPQQDLEQQVMVGAEALLRWNSRRLGRWVSPGEMLPAAGEAGLLHRLDRFVLRRAVEMIAGWGARSDAPSHLAINISIATLHDVGFAQEVKDLLDAYHVPPERLEIEIPEDLAIRDLSSVARTLTALRDVGVPLSLDDFGGGHSGLPHVVRLPVQRLKLDRSIVAGLPDDPKSYAVLRATMALARGMGIEVIGEGVETEAQAFALRRAGCHIIQGWLIARPMPADQLVPPLLRLENTPLRVSA